MAQLIFSRNQRFSFQLRLHGATTRIGRSPHCDVVLSEPEISGERAVIFAQEGQFLLKKQRQGSVRVRGAEVDSHVLQAGEPIQLGPWEAQFTLAEARRPELEPTEVT